MKSNHQEAATELIEVDKPLEEEREPERVVKTVRHTISAEETFTLAKDVFDLRCLIKSVYSNRAQIARRLGIFNTVLSTVFTVLYVAFMVFSGIRKIADFTSQIIIYSIIGAHVALTISMLAVSLVAGLKPNTKSVKKKSKLQRILRLIVRILSLAMGITAVVMTLLSGSNDVLGVALNTVALIISIVFVILSLLPLIFGGLGGLARWLMSPPKVKLKFSFVVLEWYQQIVSDNGATNATRKVSKAYLDDIGRCVDGYLLPALGKKNLGSIGVENIYAAIDRALEEDRPVVEGIIKNVFSYAMECGYISVDPLKDVQLEGSIEVEEKAKKAKRPSLKERIGKKVGKGIINSIFGSEE